jgi:hypothetical protein
MPHSHKRRLEVYHQHKRQRIFKFSLPASDALEIKQKAVIVVGKRNYTMPGMKQDYCTLATNDNKPCAKGGSQLRHVMNFQVPNAVPLEVSKSQTFMGFTRLECNTAMSVMVYYTPPGSIYHTYRDFPVDSNQTSAQGKMNKS